MPAGRKRCTFAGCRKLAPAGRKRCEDHKPGAARTPATRTRLLGCTEARLYTKPLRPLTRKTSKGWEVIDFARMIGEPLLPWQEWAVIHALELLPDGGFRFRTILILVARQNGKALDVDTEILTSRGFVTLRDIHEGDEVYHPSGHLTRVAAVSEIMPDRECCQVTTTDGRSVVADRDHLWTVTDKRRIKSLGPRGARNRWFETVTMTTGEMAAAGVSRYATGGRTSVTDGKRYATNEYRFTLPEQGPLKSPDITLPVDPYVLGAWLGDGNSANAGFCSADPEIIDEIRAAGESCRKRAGHPYAWSLSDGVRRGRGGGDATLQARLRRLGVLGNKHVPDLYLTAGTGQREALLQGLMDTDGTIEAARGQVEFCSTLRPLAEAVRFLARSLGWRATLRIGRATLNGRDCGPKYRVQFTPKTSDPFCPFRLPRKAARIGGTDGGKGRATLSIASIEPVEPRAVRCIQVESPDGLFLAGRDLIPTHNSKLKRVVTLWRMYMDGARNIIGAAQDLSLARDQWVMCQEAIHACPDLEAEWVDVRNVNGDEKFWASGCCYAIKATNDKAGRGGSNEEVNIDELRTQKDWRAWGSLSKTTMAKANGQVWAMSNAGDDDSVVLNRLRESALAGVDPSICLIEYSGEDGCELDDVQAWRQANPGLGYIVSEAAIRSAMATDPPNIFRTEVLCQKVDQLDGAIDFARWKDCADASGTLDAHRDRIAACFDAAPDGRHATLAVAAALGDGRIRVEIAGAWKTTDEARAALGPLLACIRPAAFGWYPTGPAAAMATTLRPLAMQYNKRPGKRDPAAIPEDGSISGSRVTESCQEFADLVRAARIVQPDDPLLNEHARGASKLNSGDGWRFTRKGSKDGSAEGHVDAAYAAAGAVRLAQELPPPRRARIRMIS